MSDNVKPKVDLKDAELDDAQLQDIHGGSSGNRDDDLQTTPDIQDRRKAKDKG